MAELKLTALQQRFFLAVLEGNEPAQALIVARTPRGQQPPKIKRSTAMSQGSRMMRNPAIKAALARARANVVARVELRVEDLVEQLMETRRVAFACEPPQLSAAVAATMGAGKLLGLVIDRSQIEHLRNKPSPVPTKALELDETEWRRLFDPKHNNRNDR